MSRQNFCEEVTCALDVLFVDYDALALANRSGILKDAWRLAWGANVAAENVLLRCSIQYTGLIIDL